MNAVDVLYWGDDFAPRGRTLKDVPQSEWDTPDVCGWWSVKHIIAHLASFELVLIDVLNGFLGGGPTPYLDKYLNQHPAFNDEQVARRKDNSPADVLVEYDEAQARARSLAAQIPGETLRQPDARRLAWYGAQYSLDDLIVYQYYGHKREHCAQINVFKDTLKTKGVIRES